MRQSFNALYDEQPTRSIGWPLMLADTGLLLTAFFALMLAHSEPVGLKLPTVEVALPIVDAAKDAETLLAALRQNRQDIERLQAIDLPAPVDPVAGLYRAISEGIENANVSLERQGDTIVVSLGPAGHFSAGSADLDAGAIKAIGGIGDLLAGFRAEISIEGHADITPVAGSRFRDNWELASARANAVLRELGKSSGVSGSVLKAVSFGDRKPVVAGDETLGRDRNRRVEIRIRPI